MANDIKIYVSQSDSVNVSGGNEYVFRTPEEAVDEIHRLVKDGLADKIEVYFDSGEYKTEGLKLKDIDVPISLKGNGSVVFNGGVTIDSKEFERVSGKGRERLSEEAREKVYVCDLKRLSLTAEQIGILHVIGSVNTGRKYANGKYCGNNCEVFCNGKRMTLARYPNNEFLQLTGVRDIGDCEEYPPQNYHFEWYGKTVEPRGGSVFVDRNTYARMKKWQEPEKAWMFGYFYWDWADSSSPIASLDDKWRCVDLAFASQYGYKEGAKYYLYNALEELDYPGEFYIDREELLLYVYPTDEIDECSFMITVSNNALLQADNVNGLTVEGIAFEGTRNDGIVINGNGCAVKNCTVRNIFGDAIKMTGSRNTVYGCEISHIGKGGITFKSGDNAVLEHGECVAENNYIHDWAEVFLTYTPGINIDGCGNRASHNELANSPHMAILYTGAENIIEYNYIHDVVQQSHDAGAIYSASAWLAYYGTVVRYNRLENIGNDKFFPTAIYWDNALSGQTAYGNVIKNCTGKGFLVGGGRDNIVENNIILGAEYPILCDDRARAGIVEDGWYREAMPGERHWNEFARIHYKEGAWKERYPQLSELIAKFDDATDMNVINDVHFPANMTGTRVRNNVCSKRPDTYGNYIMDSVYKYGCVENNPVYEDENDCVLNGGFELTEKMKKELPEFEGISSEIIAKMGIYNK